ncbi:hypothetical protein C1N66_13715 [Bacillus cereus]|uniref:Group-specific protein n=1 Tax=Bacillus cereus TaxID=1396 RepID=A0AB73UI66_BACCE|nr:hypothetical protein [Bacillus cereus]QHV06925.1 hypothetical protein C1N82_28345 [Bacillus cereus]QHV44125.1 hypothetical protein C1N66_13715 [Bacillus cereus]
MLWALGYLIVGMVYTSVRMRTILHKALKEEKGDEKGEAIVIVVTLLLICFFTPLWPVFLTFRFIKLFSKDCGTSAK